MNNYLIIWLLVVALSACGTDFNGGDGLYIIELTPTGRTPTFCSDNTDIKASLFYSGEVPNHVGGYCMIYVPPSYERKLDLKRGLVDRESAKIDMDPIPVLEDLSFEWWCYFQSTNYGEIHLNLHNSGVSCY